MRKTLSIIAFCSAILFFTANFSLSAENKNIQIKKQPEIQQIKPKKPVKIKLKRTAEGKYTWDLTGDDVDEIVKADKRLRKLLDIQ
jgi:predicted ATP-binding protein involved in virulence